MTARILYAVAEELSELAKNSLPALREDEIILREWFKNANLYRETKLNGQKYIAKFNFLQRKSDRILIDANY